MSGFAASGARPGSGRTGDRAGPERSPAAAALRGNRCYTSGPARLDAPPSFAAGTAAGSGVRVAERGPGAPGATGDRGAFLNSAFVSDDGAVSRDAWRPSFAAPG